MKSYIGVKIIKAEQMDLDVFNQNFRGSDNQVKPANHADSGSTVQPGYHVQYEDGYQSWSPKEVFERCYREITQSEKTLIN